jgi:hypothetical protein
MLDQDPAQEDYACVPNSLPEGAHCPLVPSDVTFESIAKNLRISDTTADILDNIRFLTACINTTPRGEDIKIRNTASWLHDQLKVMPPAATTTSDTEYGLNYIQDALRNAAIIYTWAILSIQSISSFSDEAIRHDLFVSIQSVSLKRWTKIPGIYLWIVLVACSGAPDDFRGRFLRRKMAVAAATIGFENFPLAISCVRSFWLVQRWIADRQSTRTTMRGDL